MTTNVTVLTMAELCSVFGGVVLGPNGEGCTEPRQKDTSLTALVPCWNNLASCKFKEI